MSNIVSGVSGSEHPEIMQHHEGFDFVPGNRSLSAVEVSLVNTMSRETVLRQYLTSVKEVKIVATLMPIWMTPSMTRSGFWTPGSLRSLPSANGWRRDAT